MCRGKNKCSELPKDHSLWDKRCPLKPLEWFEEELELFQKSVLLFVNSNRDECINEISKMRSKEMQKWFIEHGQMSGRHRANGLKIPKPMEVNENIRDSLRAPKKYEEEVFVRDGFRCRYCGIRMISNKVLNLFIKTLNSPVFMKGAKNLDTHGIVHIFNPVADHVIPWNLGGKTNPDNLVTSCGACNYGKDRYTIEQLGIENPFDRQPHVDSWDGLIFQLEGIKRQSERAQ